MFQQSNVPSVPAGVAPSPTQANWMSVQVRAGAFQQMRGFLPTVPIPAAAGVKPLSRSAVDVGAVRVGVNRVSLEEFMHAGQVSGLMVLKAGEVRFEAYRNGMTADSRHLLWSISKPIVATLLGILVAEGILSVEDLVVDRLPVLKGSAWDGVTLRHLLDMRGGLSWEEDEEGVDWLSHEQVYLRAELVGSPVSALEYLSRIPPGVPPGGAFRYQSIMSDMLAWVIEATTRTRLPKLLSDLLWVPMGARLDAYISVDSYGNPLADSGICASVEDLARFGELWRNGGRVGDRQLVPPGWVRDTVVDSLEARAAFAGSRRRTQSPVAPCIYRNNWLVIDPTVPFYAARGYLGQSLHVHEASGLVVAMVGAWSDHDDARDDQVAELVLELAGILSS